MTAQQDKLEHLMRSVRAGRIVHALLFTGPEGTGKKTAAMHFAQSLFCTGSLPPCGSCPACTRVLGGTHPDLHLLTPEKKQITVDQVRGIVTQLGMNAYEGGRRIVIISPADAMNEKAQNALLKTLEEPPADALFILTANSTSTLLPTILSRCQALRFQPLSINDCAEVLTAKGLNPNRAEQLAELSEGSVGAALALNENPQRAQLRENLLSSLEQRISGASVAACLTLLDLKKGDSSTALEMLDILQLWGRDLMALQNGFEPFERHDRHRLSAMKLSGAELLKRIIEARKQLNANQSPENVFGNLFFQIRKL